MDETHREMMGSFYSPEIQGCLKVVDSIVGYELNAADRQPFLYFHNFLNNPVPQFILDWRNDPATEKWYQRFTNGFLGDLQSAFACVLYHHGRLVSLEQAVMNGIEKYEYRKVLGNSTISPGNTRVWDFEYQAFILAVRRCLDYLARAACTYFKNDFHSFRKLPKFLEGVNSPLISVPLLEVHNKYEGKFEYVMSTGDRKSVRDKISHYEYVPAGSINLSRRGFMLFGGGEKLGLEDGEWPPLLSEALSAHVSNLRSFMREYITCYVDSIIADQNAKNV